MRIYTKLNKYKWNLDVDYNLLEQKNDFISRLWLCLPLSSADRLCSQHNCAVGAHPVIQM